MQIQPDFNSWNMKSFCKKNLLMCRKCFITVLMVIPSVALIFGQMQSDKLKEMISNADFILKGKVVSFSSSGKDGSYGQHIYTNYKIRVETIFKGRINDSITQFELIGGTIDNTTEDVFPSFAFNQDEEFIIFYIEDPFPWIDPLYSKIPIINGTTYFMDKEFNQVDFENAIRLFIKDSENDSDPLKGQSSIILEQDKKASISVSEISDNFLANPIITNISPAIASGGTGTQVVITGTDFGTTTGTVIFYSASPVQIGRAHV